MKPQHSNFENLPDIIKYIKRHHRHFLTKHGGMYALKMFRKHDGSRIIFEEIRGFTIRDFSVFGNNTVIIDQESHGFQVANQWRSNFDCRTYLSEVAMINVYDHCADFRSIANVDFVYLSQSRQAKNIIMTEWLHDESDVLRAQWVLDEEAEHLLADVGSRQRKVMKAPPVLRNLDLKKDDL